MKAPSKVHRILVAKGFGYDRGYYFAFIGQSALCSSIRFDKHQWPENGILIELNVFYPSVDAAGGIVPFEMSCLRADGKLWYGPDRTEPDLYFRSTDVSGLLRAVDVYAPHWLAQLADGELMVRVLDHLMGHGDAPESFAYLAQTPFLKRRETAHY